MLKRIYYWFRHKTSRPGEKGEASAGHWQHAIREHVFTLSRASGGNLLEVGCGEGLFLNKFTQDEQAFELFGVDLSLQQLLRAAKRIGDRARLYRADATKLPFKDESFDTIICINVFLNMPREELVDRALDEMQRVCKKGGCIFLEIRNKLNPLIRLKYKLARYYDATIDSERLRLFNPDAFGQKLEKRNLKVTRKTGIGFPGGEFAPIIIMEAVRGVTYD
jgi:ubiquinone/menaquinone biosynthesis C-methylase UbiE